MKWKCELCHDTGYYGDMGYGIKGNNEYIPCDCRRGKSEWDEVIEEEFILDHDHIEAGFKHTYSFELFYKYFKEDKKDVPVRIKCAKGKILIERVKE